MTTSEQADTPRLRLALLCDQGCEAVAALEAQELLGKTAEQQAGYVTINDCTLTDAAKLAYFTQSGARVLAVITEGRLQRPDDLVTDEQSRAALLTFNYQPFLSDDGSFRVSAERHGEHDWQAHEVEESLGALLHEELGFRVDLDEPAVDLRVKIVDEHYVVGVDLAGRDLGKRDYKAFHTRKSLRATIAYAALRIAGYDGEHVLVDPFCTDGAVPIEAALFATRTSPQRFKKDFSFTTLPCAAGTDWDAHFAGLDEQRRAVPGSITGFSPQVRTLKMARGNAKLAGVEKDLTLTKVEVNWLDTKFDQGGVDLLVTVPPSSGKNTPLKDVEKLQDDLFYQAKYVLGEHGKVLLITDKKAEFLNAAQRHGFILADEHEVHMGGSLLRFLAFRRATPKA